MRSLRALVVPPIACAVALASGCSADKKVSGELILAVQTDMSLPKDVDSVRIDVVSFGNVVFKNTYPVGAGGLRIPATLGILPGSNARALITIRVIASQRGKPRMLREVVTTVPETRLATLRLPIQWISDGSANQPDSTNPEDIRSTCPDGQTDIAGACVAWDVDSSTLPDYKAEDVFGGGKEDGSGGSCFDTATCLMGAATVQVDPTGCTASLPAGIGVDASRVNVGLVLPPGGDGICDDADTQCFIPLDANSSAGWIPVAGSSSTGTDVPPGEVDAAVGTKLHRQAGAGNGDALSGPITAIALPKKVCDKIRAGSVHGVVVSASCASKLPSVPTCGPWSSVTGSGGGGNGEAGINPQPCSDPVCNTTPPVGGEPAKCGCGQSCNGATYAFVCDGSTCHCTDTSKVGASFPQMTTCLDLKQEQDALTRCRGGVVADGGAGFGPQKVADVVAPADIGLATGVVGDVLIVIGKDGVLSRHTRDGSGTPVSSSPITPGGAIFNFAKNEQGAIDSANAFGSSFNGSSILRAVGIEIQPQTFATGQNGISGISVGAGRVVWGFAGGIASCPTSDCASPTAVYTAAAVKNVFSEPGGLVFFMDSTQVLACSITGCASGPNTVATNPGGATGNGRVIADAGNVYWINEQTGEVLTATRPSGVARVIDKGAPSTLPVGIFHGLAVQNGRVYYTVNDEVRMTRLDTRQTIVIAPMQSGAAAIAVDSLFVYWAAFTGGAVFRATLPP
jgi:hypothetical protein